MAPTRKRPTACVRAAAKSADPRGKYSPLSSNSTTPAAASTESSSGDALSNLKDYFGFDSASGFRINKKDKRTIKHGNLLNKVREAGISKEGGGNKRRRPAKKLKTDIGELGDALPDISENDEGTTEMDVEKGVIEDEWEGVSGDEDGAGAMRKARRRRRKVEGDGKMVMKSLKHRPGAMKKRKILEERERERFGRNLAQLVKAERVKGLAGVQGPADTHTEKWAALRTFIGGTMQKEKAFVAT